MATVRQLRQELEDAQMLELVSGAFTETSAARIPKIKLEFEKSQQFYNDLRHVYHLVRISGLRKNKSNSRYSVKDYQNILKGQLISRINKSKSSAISEGGTLAVAMTSSQRFYGSLNQMIVKRYAFDMINSDYDLLVMGSTGDEILQGIGFSRTYERMSFRRDVPNKEEMQRFLEHIAKYQSVLLYYPKFKTLVTQESDVLDICEVAELKSVEGDEVEILFEPEYNEVLEFFEHQVRRLLFLRVILEIDLSQAAARLLAMSAAEERSAAIIKFKRRQLRSAQSSIMNTKLLETFTAIRALK